MNKNIRLFKIKSLAINFWIKFIIVSTYIKLFSVNTIANKMLKMWYFVYQLEKLHGVYTTYIASRRVTKW